MFNLRLIVIASLTLTLIGCASINERSAPSTDFTVTNSYLAHLQSAETVNSEITEIDIDEGGTAAIGFRRLNALPSSTVSFSQSSSAQNLDDEATLQIAIEDMPLSAYLHYVFSEQLGLNYVLDEVLKEDSSPVTLNIIEPISQARLFELTSILLNKRKIALTDNEGVFFIHQLDDEKQNVVVGVGRLATSVPQTAQPVLQVVPMLYGINISLERTLNELTDVKVTPDFAQNTLFMRGDRTEIIKALDFVNMFDNPANRASHIGIVELTFLDQETFAEQIVSLLETEGVPVGNNTSNQKNVVLVPIEQLGSVAVFASSEQLLGRVEYWANIIDKPGKGSTEQYFTYRPMFARANDIGESLQMLIGSGSSGFSGSGNTRGASTNQTSPNTGNAPSSSRAVGVSSNGLRMVVDERSNKLIFYTSGSQYQKLLPLIKELDVLPKQVMLDITIAEVTLKDEFKFGVEWAINNTEVTLSTLGAFGANTLGGLSINVDGAKGPVNLNAFESSSLVKVVSNPTLLVRDGMTANINIGSSISVVGATTLDPINSVRQTTTTEYRETGVDITVTPTVNAQGILIMEIQQSISNTVPNSSGAGDNPDIFERSISTEVVASSGQTILLGGLISEDISDGGSNVPGTKEIPIISRLFGSQSDSKTRTELVMLITPKVIENNQEWSKLSDKFKKGLKFLNIKDD